MPNQKEIKRCRLHQLPADWKVVPLGRIAETEYGISETASDNSNAEMIGMKHLVNGAVRFEDLTPIAVDKPTIERYRIKERDLLFNRTNSFDLVGKTSIAQRVPHEQVLFASYLVRIHLNEEQATPEFVNSFLNSDIGVSRIKALATPGVSQYNLNPTSLRTQLFVPLPPLPEQQKIAAILSTWDRAIELTEKLVAAKQKRKQALMQQLLTGKVRLPGYAGKWKSIKAGDIFKPVSSKNYPDERVLSVTQDIGVVYRDELDRKIGMNMDNTGTYKLVEPGDFIISLRSFQGGLEMSRLRGIVSPAYHVIRPVMEIDQEFFRHFFKSYVFVGRLAVAVIGIRDGKQISYEDFGFLKFPMPSVQEQKAISDVLTTADREISVLTRKASTLKQQKQGLMQQLLTGKVRIKVSNQEATHA